MFKDLSEDLEKMRAEILKYRATDMMNDRERAIFLGLPDGCRIRENAKIFAPENLICGNNVWIGEGAILDAQGGLEIGNYTQIGLYVMLWSHSSHRQALSSETCISRDNIKYKRTKIGNNCFIAGHSVIAAGVTIGDKVIVLPNSFVDKDLPDNTVYGTNLELKNLYQKIEALEVEIKELKSKL